MIPPDAYVPVSATTFAGQYQRRDGEWRDITRDDGDAEDTEPSLRNAERLCEWHRREWRKLADANPANESRVPVSYRVVRRVVTEETWRAGSAVSTWVQVHRTLLKLQVVDELETLASDIIRHDVPRLIAADEALSLFGFTRAGEWRETGEWWVAAVVSR